jgi:Cu/Ag efflux protein CusF
VKKTLFTIAFALLTSVAFVSGVMAQQSSPPATQSAPSTPAKAKMEKFSGTVEKVDPAAKEIVVKKGSDEKTFSWSDQTKFMHGKKELTFTDLKKGKHVSVRYRMEGSKLTAEKISVSTKTTSHMKTPSQGKSM